MGEGMVCMGEGIVCMGNVHCTKQYCQLSARSC